MHQIGLIHPPSRTMQWNTANFLFQRTLKQKGDQRKQLTFHLKFTKSKHAGSESGAIVESNNEIEK
ncbi:hypothetical protein CR194_05570 [Salipaludibacillus keqinensis]|uniref:Uncharacterized protein n=1 Tax=Salipaludibacillus keqinensis TaxID=2045207 RepID=A0A323TZG5_9BACI|nr:hypothetical protein CR194_05570 [Salipaludibacillus keqinensis]